MACGWHADEGGRGRETGGDDQCRAHTRLQPQCAFRASSARLKPLRLCVCAAGDDDGGAWCREAMMNFATSAHHVHRTTGPGKCAFSLFAGRRTPHPEFHLLQHMYLEEALERAPRA